MSNHAKDKKSGFFQENISAEQVKDTGMAICLIALLLAYFSGIRIFLLMAIILLLLDMTVPFLFRPIAKIWFSVSFLIGSVVSRIILTLVFFTVVTPVGIIRRLMQKDTLLLRKWKVNKESVFQKRFYTYTSNDLDKPY
jgi:polyferredoxin